METSGELTAHLTLGAMVVYAIEWAKHSGWCPWLTTSTTTLNRLISFLAAIAIAVGVTWEGDASTGWVIHVPMLSALLVGIWEAVKQFVLQQVLWDSGIARRVNP